MLAVVCGECAEAGTASLASLVEIDITVTGPDGEQRQVKGTVEACVSHLIPVDLVEEWLQDQLKHPKWLPGSRRGTAAVHAPTQAPPATEPPTKEPPQPATPAPTKVEFRCQCGAIVDASTRWKHAQNKHQNARTAELAWTPLFDLDDHGYELCQCGYIARKGRQISMHLDDTGHRLNVGKAPLKSEDFKTETAKAVFRAAGQ